MIDWKLRDTILHAVYELNSQRPGPSHIENHLGDAAPSRQEINAALSWLNTQELIVGKGSLESDILRSWITPLGINYVETRTSVQELAKAAVQGSIINAQTNHNHGPAMNVVGDHNTSALNINDSSAINEVIEALREANEIGKAEELQQEANKSGIPAALKKAAGWIITNAIAAPVIGQIAPTVFAALDI